MCCIHDDNENYIIWFYKSASLLLMSLHTKECISMGCKTLYILYDYAKEGNNDICGNHQMSLLGAFLCLT